mmetsp:Transcript_32644/g.77933  ORF Transcript_32644/g.77933 Transcript_32644/m.77933 type:complete len:122 (-) Transcript_32644:54-419(-)
MLFVMPYVLRHRIATQLIEKLRHAWIELFLSVKQRLSAGKLKERRNNTHRATRILNVDATQGDSSYLYSSRGFQSIVYVADNLCQWMCELERWLCCESVRRVNLYEPSECAIDDEASPTGR